MPSHTELTTQQAAGMLTVRARTSDELTSMAHRLR
jgi:hypothetical protein